MRLSLVLASLALAACNAPLVGGECIGGFVQRGSDCVEIHTGDETTSTGGTGGAGGSGTTTTSVAGTGGSGGSGCGALVACGGTCVDVSNDPFHCGDCGTVCTSGQCNGGVCEGGLAGHVVALGFDYRSVAPGTAPAKLFGNAAFLPPHIPLRAVDFRGFTDLATATHIQDLLTTEGAARGRAIQLTHASSSGSVLQWLDIKKTDLFVLTIPTGGHADAVGLIANQWAPKLEEFGKSGGVVVILVGANVPDLMGAVLASSNLVPNLTCGGMGAGPFTVTSFLDSLTAGIPSPFVTQAPSVELSFGGSPTPTLSLPVVDTISQPIALHLVIPPGQSTP